MSKTFLVTVETRLLVQADDVKAATVQSLLFAATGLQDEIGLGVQLRGQDIVCITEEDAEGAK